MERVAAWRLTRFGLPVRIAALGVGSLAAAYASLFLELARSDRDNPLSFYVAATLLSAGISAVGVIVGLSRGRGSASRRLLEPAAVWLVQLGAALLAMAWFPIEALPLGVVLWALALAACALAFLPRPDPSRGERGPEPRET